MGLTWSHAPTLEVFWSSLNSTPMKNRSSLVLAFLIGLAISVGGAQAPAPAPATEPPHLEKRGAVTQLIVDGKPFLALAGELHNSTTSNLNYLEPIWGRLAAEHLNTVLAPVSWELIEPQEGKYDFTLVDGMLTEARRNNLRLVLLWMGSWKNGTSRYAADWVKTNQERYPRVQNQDGKTLEILTPLSTATRDADARAYAALMKHVRETDSTRHTVIMIQMQNEVGVLGDTRDHSAAANAVFGAAVPAELMTYLNQHKEALRPELREAWNAAGGKTSGTWAEIFGANPETDKIFMAWNYARYMGYVTAAGKSEYPIPVFVNTWIVQPQDKIPGDYPSGGPVAEVHDLWRAGAPAIDILCPDVYLPDFPGIVAEYARAGEPFFIPESRAGLGGAANAFYVIGQYGAIGYSPFGIEDTATWPGNSSEGISSFGSASVGYGSGDPLAKAYAVLRDLSPLILSHQADKTIAGVWLNASQTTQKVVLGNYTLNFESRRTRGAPANVPSVSYALAICLGPDEYLVAGTDIEVTFTPNTPGPATAGLLSVEEGQYVDGTWVPGRRLNGDEVQLRYDLSAAAAEGQSGAGLRFSANGPTVQRVKLYRYR